MTHKQFEFYQEKSSPLKASNTKKFSKFAGKQKGLPKFYKTKKV